MVSHPFFLLFVFCIAFIGLLCFAIEEIVNRVSKKERATKLPRDSTGCAHELVDLPPDREHFELWCIRPMSIFSRCRLCGRLFHRP